MFGPYVHQIDPILFSIAGVHLWWYGLGFALGFLEIHLWLRRGHGRLHLSLREVWSLSLFTAIGVLVGGRAVEVAFDEWPFYRAHLRLIPAFWLGGMATHGLMFGGVVGAALFARRYRKPFLLLADALVIPAAFLMGIGRLGNFIDGQIVGAVTDVSWAVKFPDADGFRHPVVLYDGAKNLVLMAYLLHVRRVNTTPGATAARFVFWYAFPRFFIDLFRDYPTHRLALGTGQTLNIVMALLGAALLYRSRLRRLGRLKSSLVTPFPGGSLDAAPLASQRIAFVCLLTFCLTIPSNWTQDIPSRYGGRHSGLEYSWLYPMIDTAPPPLPAEIAAPDQSRGRSEVGVTRWWPSRAVQRSKRPDGAPPTAGWKPVVSHIRVDVDGTAVRGRLPAWLSLKPLPADADRIRRPLPRRAASSRAGKRPDRPRGTDSARRADPPSPAAWRRAQLLLPRGVSRRPCCGDRDAAIG